MESTANIGVASDSEFVNNTQLKHHQTSTNTNIRQNDALKCLEYYSFSDSLGSQGLGGCLKDIISSLLPLVPGWFIPPRFLCFPWYQQYDRDPRVLNFRNGHTTGLGNYKSQQHFVCSLGRNLKTIMIDRIWFQATMYQIYNHDYFYVNPIIGNT